ncbi:cytidylyltransferase domain-containing protein [Saccharospirillum mangrovi]|uniref:acylneuraminate cytidylyltransferase family protein n=1 Tax=Saccharospirillum mangrovi TaxID=2161747 RepID=UPI000D3328E6|nr:acylneuraminate cytidylyltransferase family protein [Saccharospirillum mangrovi]
MKACAWIFARGGSKGVPGKNIRELHGKPLIAWSIEQARASGCFERVLVSTDDERIAEVAQQFGADVPFMRPAELAADTSPEWLAWQHAAAWQGENEPELAGFVSVPATAPLRAPTDIQAAWSLLQQSTNDLVLAVTPASHHPNFNLVRLSSQRGVSLWETPTATISRRQDATPAFHITTVVYATTVQHVLAAKGVLDGAIGAIELPGERAVDIDTVLDFEWARFLMEHAHAATDH